MELKTRLGKGGISHARRSVFVAKAVSVHGGKYDYSRVVIRTGEKDPKVLIACPVHGDFFQRMGCHVKGHGCLQCGNDARYGDGKTHRRVTCKYCGKPRRISERWVSGLVCSDCEHHHSMTIGHYAKLSPWQIASRKLAKIAASNHNCRRTSDDWYRWANNKQSTVSLRKLNPISRNVKTLSNWKDAAKRITHTWRRSLYSPECKWRRWSHRKRATMKTAEQINSKRKVAVTATEIYDLVKRQDFRCAITGDKLEVNDATIDHIIPVSYGGGNGIENLQVVTKAANRVKGNLTMEQLVELCQRIVNKHGDSFRITND